MTMSIRDYPDSPLFFIVLFIFWFLYLSFSCVFNRLVLYVTWSWSAFALIPR